MKAFDVLRIALLAAVYVVVAKAGLSLDAVSGFATLVWPPTGISLVALLIFGIRLWPGVALGAFVVNLWTGAPVLVACGMAAGNCLEAVVGVALLRRVGFRASLERPRDVLALVVLAAAASTAVSACIGVGSLILGGIVPPAKVVTTFRAWWLGDAIGDLIVAPLLLTWRLWNRKLPPTRRLAEAGGLILTLAAIGGWIFFLYPRGAVAPLRHPYMLFPVFLWAVLRFGQRGAVTAMFLSSVISVWGTALSNGPFVQGTLADSLFSLQVFMAVASITVLIMGALMAEHEWGIREQEQMGFALLAREQAADALRRERDAIQAANRELESFSHSISHDLRAPLRAIDGFSQALFEDYRDKVDVQGQDYLLRIRAAAQRMGQLIDDLLVLARVTRAELTRKPVDLTALAREVVAGCRSDRPDRRVEFVVQRGLSAEGDVVLLRVVLENLIGNAWKFTGAHSHGRIEVGRDETRGETPFFVRDDGVGFSMAYVGKLFQPFQRLHKEKDFPGTGIGLATVARIVQRHGGRVWAEAEEDRGATFYFTLPPAPPVPEEPLPVTR